MSSTNSSSSRTSSPILNAILDNALDDYTEQTGVDLTEYDFAKQLEGCSSPEDVLRLFSDKAGQFKEYREGNLELINWISPIVQVVHMLSGFLGEALSENSFSPGKAIFVGVDVLLVTAIAVNSSYDALIDLFECTGSFLRRINIYTEVPITDGISDIIVNIMTEVLSILALATKQIKHRRFKEFSKKLLGESDIVAVLQRLDRLTEEEARMTVALTLQVVYGLVKNVKVVMDVDAKVSIDGFRQALGSPLAIAYQAGNLLLAW